MCGNSKKYRFISCVALFCLLLPQQAQQNEGWIDVAEENLSREEDPGLTEQHCEEQQELLFYPINLNTATQLQLESCGLFTRYQAHVIIHHREALGELFSVYELASLPGFRKGRLEDQAIYMTVDETGAVTPPEFQRSIALLYAGYTAISSEKQSAYPGSLWKTSLRLKKGLGKKGSMGVAYEKDPGEKYHWGNRPEHLCGYLEWKGNKVLEQIIVGTYRLNNGMGLIQGAGLMHTAMGIHSRPLLLSKLKPYAGAGESLMHQGIAGKLNLGSIKLVLWSSLQAIDLSLAKLSAPLKDTDWPDYIREYGYHRTPNEQAGRNLAYLGSAGIQVLVSLDRLNLGLQYSPEINGLTHKGKDSLQYFEGPGYYHGASIHWQYRLENIELYGEFVPGAKRSNSFLAGSRFFINDFLSGTLQTHWYGASHRETFASAYASGSHIENERGVLFLIHAEPMRAIRCDVALELFAYPAPRTQVKVPSSGYRFSVTLHNGSLEKLQWRLRLLNSSRQKTPLSFDHPEINPLANIQTQRIDGRVVYAPLPWITWQSRLVISYSPKNLAEGGHAALQQVTLRLRKKLRCTAQFVVYHIPSWTNRIYLYEPGLYQQFRFPVYSGTGNKFSIVFSLKLGRRLTLEARGSKTRESEKKRWEADMQLRLNF